MALTAFEIDAWGGRFMQIILTVIFGTVSIVLVIYTILQAKQKKPVWAYETTRIIDLDSSSPAELKLTFNGRHISDAYRTILILFNKGREAIRKGDVAENIAINFEEAEILRQPIIKVKSKESIKFSATSQGNSAILDFLYLGHNDGAVIEIFHTKSKKITCSGDIIGAKNINYIGEFVLFANRHSRGWWARFILILIVPFLVLLGLVLRTDALSFTSTKDILPLVLGFLAYYIGFFGAKPRKAYIFKKFPDWSFY